MKRLGLDRGVKKAFQGCSRGFTLIEVVIAMLLLGIIGVAILTSLSYASTVLIIADRQATAESLARTQMESIKNQSYIDYSNPAHDDYEVITTPEGYEIEPVTVEQIEVGLQKITVTVNYYILRYNISTRGSELVQKQFILEDYKRNPVT